MAGLLLLLREHRPDGIVRLTFMAHFHITAVFETRGASQAEAERVAAAVLPLLRHPRMHYYEHDTSGGLGPYPPGQSLYFTTMAEFDVEAYTEEKAVELAEDLLDRLSTEDIQYLGHGIIPGNPRVQPEDRRSAREEEREPAAEPDEGQDGRGERGGKGRRPQRGRGRKLGRRDTESEMSAEGQTPEPARETANEVPDSVSVDLTPEAKEPAPAPPPRARVVRDEPVPVVSPVEMEEAIPPPPPRSSAAMRVTLTVTLRASEVAQSQDHTAPTGEELIALAIAEARRRHPELPAEIAPDSATSSLPAGDRLISLTWHYQSPVPSAAEAE